MQEEFQEILNENKQLFYNIFIDGYNQRGYGVLLADLDDSKTIFLTLDDLYMIDEHYENENISKTIQNIFDDQNMNQDNMIVFFIKNGQLIQLNEPIS